MSNIFITFYSSPTYINRHRDHHQGNLQEDEKSKPYVKILCCVICLCSPWLLFVLTEFVLTMSTVCVDCVNVQHACCLCWRLCSPHQEYCLCWLCLYSPWVLFVLNEFVFTLSTVCADCVCVHHEYCLCWLSLCSTWVLCVLTVFVFTMSTVCADYVCVHHENSLCWLCLCSPWLLFVLTTFVEYCLCRLSLCTQRVLCTHYICSE